jgi:hypothetical protein
MKEVSQLALPPSEQAALAELARMRPRLDGISQDSQRDYFAVLTNSWVTYSGTMTAAQKQELLNNVGEELQHRVAGLKAMYEDDESSPSPPRAT